MYTNYYNKQAKYNTQLNQFKRVLKSRCIKVAEFLGITALLVALYLEFWIIAG